jgi:hypothetical protein
MFPEPSRDAWFPPPYRQLEPGELAQDGDEANSPHNPADRGWCIIGKEIFLEDGHPAYKHLILRTKRPKPCNDANTVVEPDGTGRKAPALQEHDGVSDGHDCVCADCDEDADEAQTT